MQQETSPYFRPVSLCNLSSMGEIGDDFLAGLERIMDARGLRAAPLSEAAGLSKSFIRDLRRGKAASPKLDTAMKVARALGISVEEILAAANGSVAGVPTISIAGRVGAGAKVPVFEAYERGAGPQVECPVGLSPQGIAAVEIVGESMEPVYSAGDLLFYSRPTHEGVPSEAIGRRCVCECERGFGWIKLVKLGSQPGYFHLIALNPDAENQHDVRLKWAAPVRLHWPADLAKRV
ncbi:helix-turn-helix domain-containing protein [Rhodovulum sulfidophilum]|nr:helix-turn-helix domain-containing protein [Rhodovulum sulfidophilum]MCE8432628.1 helix-turn-helix domain-containing protein [Rhodovulum sulfidophilum]MCE8442181.1 helix-turn-helix domain-containing protein [Rhodovulum sulfidophilum]MCE8455531.1 helix-turn-helix domain-containing protein [Rhodovulum sulfidophilum]MCE8469170.1 helix-turn-helix domain-containing protein [Rhodovulum sulfidophilum]MCF4115764.1 helix-turn-helix domain-containing protein [Rhodovulum sulfidophilum]